MVDLTREMADLWAELGPVHGKRGRVVQFVSARSGEGTSTVAREFARLAAVRARKPVWLVDADLADQCQLEICTAEPHRFGAPGPHASASPDGSLFFTVDAPTPREAQDAPPDAKLVVARPFLGGRLWVTRFRRDQLAYARRARLAEDGAYWSALAGHAEYVVVDSPAGDRSDAAMVMAPHMDATVIVVAAETPADAAVALRDEIEASGGSCAGVVFNKAAIEPPKFLRRWL